MSTPTREEILELLNSVMDPEVPVISVVELGVVREVHFLDDKVQVDITPTYSGCPAMKMMEEQIIEKLNQNGLDNVEVKVVYAPAWTTDWITDEAKEKLEKYGIAPPGKAQDGLVEFPKRVSELRCPFCHSTDTKIESEFGSTACKSLHYCNACQQPFEHFKAF